MHVENTIAYVYITCVRFMRDHDRELGIQTRGFLQSCVFRLNMKPFVVLRLKMPKGRLIGDNARRVAKEKREEN